MLVIRTSLRPAAFAAARQHDTIAISRLSGRPSVSRKSPRLLMGDNSSFRPALWANLSNLQVRRRRLLRNSFSFRFLTHHCQRAFARISGIAIGVMDALSKDLQSHFLHSSAHFAQAVSCCIFAPCRTITKEGLLQNFQSIFLQPRQMKGRLPAN